MSRVSNLKICLNIEITDKQSNFICVCLDLHMYFENESCLYFRIFENTLRSIVLT
jgi:hypothetical protein